jgi:hypothetical protein
VAREAAIDVSSSDTESDSGGAKRPRRRRRVGREEKRARVLDAVPPGFLEPLPPRRCVTKQFWKAGDYDGKEHLLWSEHAKHSGTVHPRSFLLCNLWWGYCRRTGVQSSLYPVQNPEGLG